MNGYFSLILHAHLPFVRHPEYEEFLEEDWLYEAITETYIPILKVMERLKNDNVKFDITMTISGTLSNMLKDDLLISRYMKHLDKMIEFCELEKQRLQGDMLAVANMNYDLFNDAKTYMIESNYNILSRFKEFQDLGYLEIIPVTATHGMLPMMKEYPRAVNAQVLQAKLDYMENFGVQPKGIWLAECAYYPNQDEFLAKHGIQYFIVDSHAINNANPRPKYSVYAPVYTKNGVAAFARDIESSEQVWSAEIGYPGDGTYREFHKDAGYELDYDYVKDYLHKDGVRRNMGIKYHAITDKKGSYKMVYNPQAAYNKAKEHAYNFVFNRTKQIEHLFGNMKYRKPIIISPYDAELYGHWWFEGPIFIEHALRAIQISNFETITPSKYLKLYPLNQVVDVSMSSWGGAGYFDVWVDGTNDYIYRHLHKAAEKMIEMSDREPINEIEYRALNQMARELLLAQTSCWPFILYTNTMTGYAHKKISDHVNRLFRLYEEIKNNNIDIKWLEELEKRDNIFKNINYRIYRG